jgi:hypothetical protein
LRFNVGNIMPGQSALISLKYAILLQVENGSYALRLPTAYFPRVGPIEVEEDNEETKMAQPEDLTKVGRAEYAVDIKVEV